MQSVSSRIWTRVAVSISYNDNHYTTGKRLLVSWNHLTVQMIIIVVAWKHITVEIVGNR